MPTLDGTARVKVPPGSSTGRKLRLRGQGMPGPRGGARRPLRDRSRSMVPKKPTDEERELFERLAEVSKFNPREGALSAHDGDPARRRTA